MLKFDAWMDLTSRDMSVANNHMGSHVRLLRMLKLFCFALNMYKFDCDPYTQHFLFSGDLINFKNLTSLSFLTIF